MAPVAKKRYYRGLLTICHGNCSRNESDCPKTNYAITRQDSFCHQIAKSHCIFARWRPFAKCTVCRQDSVCEASKPRPPWFEAHVDPSDRVRGLEMFVVWIILPCSRSVPTSSDMRLANIVSFIRLLCDFVIFQPGYSSHVVLMLKRRIIACA